MFSLIQPLKVSNVHKVGVTLHPVKHHDGFNTWLGVTRLYFVPVEFPEQSVFGLRELIKVWIGREGLLYSTIIAISPFKPLLDRNLIP